MQSPPTDALLESRTHEPELAASSTNRLMLAVLEEALVTFRRGLRSNDVLQRHHSWEVDRWIASTDGDPLFSFENICSSLSIDPGYVRDGLKRIKIAAREGRSDDLASRRLLRRERIYDRRAWRGRIR
jgi:hypothetical protein